MHGKSFGNIFMLGEVRLFKYFNPNLLGEPEAATPFIDTIETITQEVIEEVKEKPTFWDLSARNQKEKDVHLYKGFGKNSMSSRQKKRFKKKAATTPQFCRPCK